MSLATCCGVVLLLMLGGCAASPSPPSKTARALRYRQYVVESSWQGTVWSGSWHDVVFLPDAGVVGTVVWDAARPVAHARHAKLDDELARRPRKSEGLLPPVDITIDAGLAQQLIALADFTARQNTLAGELAARLVRNGAVGGEQSVKAELFLEGAMSPATSR